MYGKLMRELEEAESMLAFDRASLDEYAAAAGAERERLTAELDAAREHLAAVEAIAAESGALEERLGAMVLAAHRVVAEEQADCRRAVQAILDAADQEAATIVGNARAKAAALRAHLTVGDDDWGTPGPRPVRMVDAATVDASRRGRDGVVARAVAV